MSAFDERGIGEPGPISILSGVNLKVGDAVEKFTGEARWFGWIVSIYPTRRGKLRCVVEVFPQGFQMIAIHSQLRPCKEDEFLY